MSDQVVPYRIAVPDAELDELRRRLQGARLPALLDASPDDGVVPDRMHALIDRWTTGFDWRAQEASLNRLPQFVTTIDEQIVHFVHERSERSDAIPLLLVHGWPSTFAEFRHVVDVLAHPGDTSLPAFHVVVPSLPGYGPSGPTSARDWGGVRMAAAFAALMQRLGYPRYVPHGGDIGYSVATLLGRLDPDHVPAVHLSLGGVGLTAAHQHDDPEQHGDAERRAVRQLDLYVREKSGYAHIQGTRPQTLAYALSDSPVGQLAWIAEKFAEWADPAHPVAEDDLLTTVALYWFTNTAASSGRFYRSGFSLPMLLAPGTRSAPRLDVPTGITAWPHEIVVPVRRWAERDYQVVYWAEPPAGGHFAALETPELLVSTLRSFAQQVL